MDEKILQTAQRLLFISFLLLNLIENPKRWSEKLGLLYKQHVIA